MPNETAVNNENKKPVKKEVVKARVNCAPYKLNARSESGEIVNRLEDGTEVVVVNRKAPMMSIDGVNKKMTEIKYKGATAFVVTEFLKFDSSKWEVDR